MGRPQALRPRPGQSHAHKLSKLLKLLCTDSLLCKMSVNTLSTFPGTLRTK